MLWMLRREGSMEPQLLLRTPHTLGFQETDRGLGTGSRTSLREDTRLPPWADLLLTLSGGASRHAVSCCAERPTRHGPEGGLGGDLAPAEPSDESATPADSLAAAAWGTLAGQDPS